LAQNCGNRTWGTSSVENMLEKTVECAVALHKQCADDNANHEQKESLLKEHKWKELDAKFETAILAITQKEGIDENDYVW
jgi:hypothetical protein